VKPAIYTSGASSYRDVGALSQCESTDGGRGAHGPKPVELVRAEAGAGVVRRPSLFRARDGVGVWEGIVVRKKRRR